MYALRRSGWEKAGGTTDFSPSKSYLCPYKRVLMKRTLLLSLLSTVSLLFTSCSPDDRADEQPFAPTVATLSAEAAGDSCVLQGAILASPNSRVTGRGFYYGNDTLRVQVISRDTLTTTFREVVDSIAPGIYYACAFATNGMGTSFGDTLHFQIAEHP